jgi:hypothetical protein
MIPPVGHPLIESLLATTPMTVHDWTFSAFGWHFGVVEENLRDFTWSTVYLGPIGIQTHLSATTVTAIAGGALILLFVGTTAVAARSARRNP